MKHPTCNRRSVTHPPAQATISQFRWLCALAVLLGIFALGAQGCASSRPAGDGLTRFATEQEDVNPSPALAQAACDPEDDEVLPLQAGPTNSMIGERELAQQVTRYLNDHCFPLVRAAFARPADSYPEMIIYGFVATDFAKRDAEAIADALLASTVINVKDAIMVRPGLPAAPPNTNTATKDAADTAQQIAIEQYQKQNGFMSIPPLSSLSGLGISGSLSGAGNGVLVIPAAATNAESY